jgi:hexokinase
MGAQTSEHMRMLVLDIGGTHVKVLATGHKQQVMFPYVSAN